MSREERIADILAAWQDARLRGDSADLDELLGAHPDLADELRARLRALQLLELAGAEEGLPTPAMPETIGEYRIVRELGRGGMGVVYEAEQIALRRRVALKVLFPALGRPVGAIERFKREARAAARLNHTNILSVHSLGEESGAWYYAMDLVSGASLDRVLDMARSLEGGPPSLETTAEERAAEVFVVTQQTILNWRRVMRRKDPQLLPPLRGLPDLVHELVHRLKAEWPRWGTRRIAGQLARLGVKASRSRVQRIPAMARHGQGPCAPRRARAAAAHRTRCPSALRGRWAEGVHSADRADLENVEERVRASPLPSSSDPRAGDEAQILAEMAQRAQAAPRTRSAHSRQRVPPAATTSDAERRRRRVVGSLP